MSAPNPAAGPTPIDPAPSDATPASPAPAGPATQARSGDRVPKAIAFMLIATVAFAVMHALAKWLIATIPVGQVMFSRSFVGLAICAAILLPRHGFSVFATTKPKAHVARGLSQSLSQTFAVLAFSLMPLAGAVAINFSAPLWAALAAVIFLGERPGPARWLVLLAGFGGVLLVSNPGADSLTLGVLFALANAILLGTVTVAVRGMSATEKPNTLLIWQLATVTAFHAVLLLFGVRWPTPLELGMLIGCGLANLVGQYFWTRSLVLAPASAVSPFFYFMLIWVAVIGYFVWGDVPTLHVVTGSLVVVAAGLFLLWHESKPRPPVTASKSA